MDRAVERYGMEFDDLAGLINARANEIRDARELERQRELERERAQACERDDGWDWEL
ncbi:hypothetical protein [Palleronia caenipelagi]|uniref:hypothetical protein n=1 Tax=Palleronia caenipelagi TaxID=2489174 RepID=UPI001C8F7C57|nr:hypothetical protein [Palleronia caenipelagi]